MATFISVKTLKLFFVIVCALHKPRNIWRCNQGKQIFQNKEPFVSESTTARWESGRSQTVTTSSLIREISSYKLGQALSNTQLSYWAVSFTTLLRNPMRDPAFFWLKAVRWGCSQLFLLDCKWFWMLWTLLVEMPSFIVFFSRPTSKWPQSIQRNSCWANLFWGHHYCFCQDVEDRLSAGAFGRQCCPCEWGIFSTWLESC